MEDKTFILVLDKKDRMSLISEIPMEISSNQIAAMLI